MERPAEVHSPTTRSRAWIGWVIVAVAAAGVGASFLIRGDEEAAAEKKGGGKAATAVAAVEVTRGAITQRGRYPGELDADATDVAAFYAGRVAEMKVRVGDTVTEGQVVAVLDPVDAREQIAQARAQAKAAAAERVRAKVDRDQAHSEVKRLEPLARDQLISQLEVDRQRAKANALEAAVEAAAAGESEANARVKLLERRLIESSVKAPFAGRVAERYIDPGTVVPAGARLVRIVQTAPLRVRFQVPERDVAQLSAGTSLRVVTAASTGEGVAATVSGVASEVNRERRTAFVEAVIDAPPPGWLPGMYAEAVVDLRSIPDATLVPASAVLSRLQPDGKVSTGVFVAVDGGVARWVPIREVTREADTVAIEAKLEAGARVLVAGHVDLSDGSRVVVRDEDAKAAEAAGAGAK